MRRSDKAPNADRKNTNAFQISDAESITSFMDITIRSARADDIPALCHLLDGLFSLESDFTPDREKQAKGLRLLLEKPPGSSIVLVAGHKGQAVGMCSVQTFLSTAEGGPAGFIEDVVVSREFRGRGVGTRLLEGSMSWCRAQGITRLQLLADRDNAAALQFYSSRRWTCTGLICLRKYI
jgi:GNAT superfamily N-acetyltransferase